MNIILVGHFGFPDGSAGASRIRHMAAGLSELGHSVHVISLRPVLRNSPVAPGSWSEWSGVPYCSTAGTMGPVRGSLREKLLVQYQLLYAGPKAAVRQLHALHQRTRIDAILGYSNLHIGLSWVLSWARASGIRVFRDVVEWWQPYSFPGGRLNPVYWNTWLNMNVALPRSDGIIAISSAIARRFMELGRPTIRVPAIIDPRQWSFDPMVPREKAAPFRLMYLGDMNQRDVPVIMVTALKRLIERGHDLVLDVVGGVKFVGPAAQARGMSQQDPILRGRVSFYGRVSDEEVRHRFSAAHALLFTRRAGRTAQAAFPTRLPEFLMTRRPVISTAIGDIPEYLPDGQAAVLVKPEDMDDLVAGIERLLAMPDEGRALGEAGCEACTRYFDYRVRSVEIASFMEAVVSGKYCSTPR